MTFITKLNSLLLNGPKLRMNEVDINNNLNTYLFYPNLTNILY